MTRITLNGSPRKLSPGMGTQTADARGLASVSNLNDSEISLGGDQGRAFVSRCEPERLGDLLGGMGGHSPCETRKAVARDHVTHGLGNSLPVTGRPARGLPVPSRHPSRYPVTRRLGMTRSDSNPSRVAHGGSPATCSGIALQVTPNM